MPATCTAVEDGWSSAPGVLAPDWVMLSRSIFTYPTPSAPLAGAPRLRHSVTYTRCLRCAGAPRRPTRGSELSLTIPSWHAALTDPGEFEHRICPINRCRYEPSPRSERLGTLEYPAIRFTRGTYFEAYPVRLRYGLPGCSPSCTDQTGDFPAYEGFYSPAFHGLVTLPVAEYHYDSHWTPCRRDFHPLE
jgi:hypothetical protein